MTNEGSRRLLGGFAFLRAVKFAIATGLGFLVAEAILVLCVIALYHTATVPGLSESPTILGLDALSLGVGSTAAFLVNERVTVTKQDSGTSASWPVRWAKYQLAKLLGNILIVVIQIALLATVSLSPIYGSIVGAILSYPVTYAVSMVFVWRVHPLREYAKPGESRKVDLPEMRRVAFRIVEFALASGFGFLIAEAIIVLGVITFYHAVTVPGLSYSSPTIIELDALALVTGVTVAFSINERVTVKGQGEERRKGRSNWFVRLLKYQLASLLGNLIIVGVQLALLATTSLSPVFGSVVGAVLSYPVTYAVSMRFVWKIHPLGD